jgi:Helix-turn-helix of DDE superfamily endonuclease
MPSYEEVTQRAGSLRSMTGLTEAEFMALLPHCEQAFVISMQDRTIDGQPRTSRRYTTYDTCPLPTTADKLLFILTYVKQHPIHEVQGPLLGMSQSQANQWIHLLPPVLNRALSDQELLPARTADDLAARLTTPPTDASAPSALFSMMGPHDPSSVRKTRRSRKSMTVARRNATRSKTSS